MAPGGKQHQAFQQCYTNYQEDPTSSAVVLEAGRMFVASTKYVLHRREEHQQRKMTAQQQVQVPDAPTEERHKEGPQCCLGGRVLLQTQMQENQQYAQRGMHFRQVDCDEDCGKHHGGQQKSAHICFYHSRRAEKSVYNRRSFIRQFLREKRVPFSPGPFPVVDGAVRLPLSRCCCCCRTGTAGNGTNTVLHKFSSNLTAHEVACDALVRGARASSLSLQRAPQHSIAACKASQMLSVGAEGTSWQETLCGDKSVYANHDPRGLKCSELSTDSNSGTESSSQSQYRSNTTIRPADSNTSSESTSQSHHGTNTIIHFNRSQGKTVSTNSKQAGHSSRRQQDRTEGVSCVQCSSRRNGIDDTCRSGSALVTSSCKSLREKQDNSVSSIRSSFALWARRQRVCEHVKEGVREALFRKTVHTPAVAVAPPVLATEVCTSTPLAGRSSSHICGMETPYTQQKRTAVQAQQQEGAQDKRENEQFPHSPDQLIAVQEEEQQQQKEKEEKEWQEEGVQYNRKHSEFQHCSDNTQKIQLRNQERYAPWQQIECTQQHQRMWQQQVQHEDHTYLVGQAQQQQQQRVQQHAQQHDAQCYVPKGFEHKGEQRVCMCATMAHHYQDESTKRHHLVLPKFAATAWARRKSEQSGVVFSNNLPTPGGSDSVSPQAVTHGDNGEAPVAAAVLPDEWTRSSVSCSTSSSNSVSVGARTLRVLFKRSSALSTATHNHTMKWATVFRRSATADASTSAAVPAAFDCASAAAGSSLSWMAGRLCDSTRAESTIIAYGAGGSHTCVADKTSTAAVTLSRVWRVGEETTTAAPGLATENTRLRLFDVTTATPASATKASLRFRKPDSQAPQQSFQVDALEKQKSQQDVITMVAAVSGSETSSEFHVPVTRISVKPVASASDVKTSAVPELAASHSVIRHSQSNTEGCRQSQGGKEGGQRACGCKSANRALEEGSGCCFEQPQPRRGFKRKLLREKLLRERMHLFRRARRRRCSAVFRALTAASELFLRRRRTRSQSLTSCKGHKRSGSNSACSASLCCRLCRATAVMVTSDEKNCKQALISYRQSAGPEPVAGRESAKGQAFAAALRRSASDQAFAIAGRRKGSDQAAALAVRRSASNPAYATAVRRDASSRAYVIKVEGKEGSHDRPDALKRRNSVCSCYCDVSTCCAHSGHSIPRGRTLSTIENTECYGSLSTSSTLWHCHTSNTSEKRCGDVSGRNKNDGIRQRTCRYEISEKDRRYDLRQRDCCFFNVSGGHSCCNMSERGLRYDTLSDKDCHCNICGKGLHHGTLDRNSFYDISDRDSHLDINNRHLHYDRCDTDSHYDACDGATHRDICDKDAHYDAYNRHSHYDRGDRDSHYDICNRRSHSDICDRDCHYDMYDDRDCCYDLNERSFGCDVCEKDSRCNRRNVHCHYDISDSEPRCNMSGKDCSCCDSRNSPTYMSDGDDSAEVGECVDRGRWGYIYSDKSTTSQLHVEMGTDSVSRNSSLTSFFGSLRDKMHPEERGIVEKPSSFKRLRKQEQASGSHATRSTCRGTSTSYRSVAVASCAPAFAAGDSTTTDGVTFLSEARDCCSQTSSSFFGWPAESAAFSSSGACSTLPTCETSTATEVVGEKRGITESGMSGAQAMTAVEKRGCSLMPGFSGEEATATGAEEEGGNLSLHARGICGAEAVTAPEWRRGTVTPVVFEAEAFTAAEEERGVTVTLSISEAPATTLPMTAAEDRGIVAPDAFGAETLTAVPVQQERVVRSYMETTGTTEKRDAACEGGLSFAEKGTSTRARGKHAMPVDAPCDSPTEATAPTSFVSGPLAVNAVSTPHIAIGKPNASLPATAHPPRTTPVRNLAGLTERFSFAERATVTRWTSTTSAALPHEMAATIPRRQTVVAASQHEISAATCEEALRQTPQTIGMKTSAAIVPGADRRVCCFVSVSNAATPTAHPFAVSSSPDPPAASKTGERIRTTTSIHNGYYEKQLNDRYTRLHMYTGKYTCFSTPCPLSGRQSLSLLFFATPQDCKERSVSPGRRSSSQAAIVDPFTTAALAPLLGASVLCTAMFHTDMVVGRASETIMPSRMRRGACDDRLLRICAAATICAWPLFAARRLVEIPLVYTGTVSFSTTAGCHTDNITVACGADPACKDLFAYVVGIIFPGDCGPPPAVPRVSNAAGAVIGATADTPRGSVLAAATATLIHGTGIVYISGAGDKGGEAAIIRYYYGGSNIRSFCGGRLWGGGGPESLLFNDTDKRRRIKETPNECAEKQLTNSTLCTTGTCWHSAGQHGTCYTEPATTVGFSPVVAVLCLLQTVSWSNCWLRSLDSCTEKQQAETCRCSCCSCWSLHGADRVTLNREEVRPWCCVCKKAAAGMFDTKVLRRSCNEVVSSSKQSVCAVEVSGRKNTGSSYNPPMTNAQPKAPTCSGKDPLLCFIKSGNATRLMKSHYRDIRVLSREPRIAPLCESVCTRGITKLLSCSQTCIGCAPEPEPVLISRQASLSAGGSNNKGSEKRFSPCANLHRNGLTIISCWNSRVDRDSVNSSNGYEQLYGEVTGYKRDIPRRNWDSASSNGGGKKGRKTSIDSDSSTYEDPNVGGVLSRSISSSGSSTLNCCIDEHESSEGSPVSCCELYYSHEPELCCRRLQRYCSENDAFSRLAAPLPPVRHVTDSCVGAAPPKERPRLYTGALGGDVSRANSAAQARVRPLPATTMRTSFPSGSTRSSVWRASLPAASSHHAPREMQWDPQHQHQAGLENNQQRELAWRRQLQLSWDLQPLQQYPWQHQHQHQRNQQQQQQQHQQEQQRQQQQQQQEGCPQQENNFVWRTQPSQQQRQVVVGNYQQLQKGPHTENSKVKQRQRQQHILQGREAVESSKERETPAQEQKQQDQPQSMLHKRLPPPRPPRAYSFSEANCRTPVITSEHGQPPMQQQQQGIQRGREFGLLQVKPLQHASRKKHQESISKHHQVQSRDNPSGGKRASSASLIRSRSLLSLPRGSHSRTGFRQEQQRLLESSRRKYSSSSSDSPLIEGMEYIANARSRSCREWDLDYLREQTDAHKPSKRSLTPPYERSQQRIRPQQLLCLSQRQHYSHHTVREGADCQAGPLSLRGATGAEEKARREEGNGEKDDVMVQQKKNLHDSTIEREARTSVTDDCMQKSTQTERGAAVSDTSVTAAAVAAAAVEGFRGAPPFTTDTADTAVLPRSCFRGVRKWLQHRFYGRGELERLCTIFSPHRVEEAVLQSRSLSLAEKQRLFLCLTHKTLPRAVTAGAHSDIEGLTFSPPSARSTPGGCFYTQDMAASFRRNANSGSLCMNSSHHVWGDRFLHSRNSSSSPRISTSSRRSSRPRPGNGDSRFSKYYNIPTRGVWTSSSSSSSGWRRLDTPSSRADGHTRTESSVKRGSISSRSNCSSRDVDEEDYTHVRGGSQARWRDLSTRFRAYTLQERSDNTASVCADNACVSVGGDKGKTNIDKNGQGDDLLNCMQRGRSEGSMQCSESGISNCGDDSSVHSQESLHCVRGNSGEMWEEEQQETDGSKKTLLLVPLQKMSSTSLQRLQRMREGFQRMRGSRRGFGGGGASGILGTGASAGREPATDVRRRITAEQRSARRARDGEAISLECGDMQQSRKIYPKHMKEESVKADLHPQQSTTSSHQEEEIEEQQNMCESALGDASQRAALEGCVDEVQRKKAVKNAESFRRGFLRNLAALRGLSFASEHLLQLQQQSVLSNAMQHQEKFSKLWGLLMPDMRLPSRVCKEWKELGFQGEDPSTDFRGCGVLALDSLVFLAGHFTAHARRMLHASRQQQWWYSFAITNVNVTSWLIEWVVERRPDVAAFFFRTYSATAVETTFHYLCAYLFTRFHNFWMCKRPASIMEFPFVAGEFKQVVEFPPAAFPACCLLTKEGECIVLPARAAAAAAAIKRAAVTTPLPIPNLTGSKKGGFVVAATTKAQVTQRDIGPEATMATPTDARASDTLSTSAGPAAAAKAGPAAAYARQTTTAAEMGQRRGSLDATMEEEGDGNCSSNRKPGDQIKKEPFATASRAASGTRDTANVTRPSRIEVATANGGVQERRIETRRPRIKAIGLPGGGRTPLSTHALYESLVSAYLESLLQASLPCPSAFAIVQEHARKARTVAAAAAAAATNAGARTVGVTSRSRSLCHAEPPARRLRGGPRRLRTHSAWHVLRSPSLRRLWAGGGGGGEISGTDQGAAAASGAASADASPNVASATSAPVCEQAAKTAEAAGDGHGFSCVVASANNPADNERPVHSKSLRLYGGQPSQGSPSKERSSNTSIDDPMTYRQRYYGSQACPTVAPEENGNDAETKASACPCCYNWQPLEAVSLHTGQQRGGFFPMGASPLLIRGRSVDPAQQRYLRAPRDSRRHQQLRMPAASTPMATSLIGAKRATYPTVDRRTAFGAKSSAWPVTRAPRTPRRFSRAANRLSSCSSCSRGLRGMSVLRRYSERRNHSSNDSCNAIPGARGRNRMPRIVAAGTGVARDGPFFAAGGGRPSCCWSDWKAARLPSRTRNVEHLPRGAKGLGVDSHDAQATVSGPIRNNNTSDVVGGSRASSDVEFRDERHSVQKRERERLIDSDTNVKCGCNIRRSESSRRRRERIHTYWRGRSCTRRRSTDGHNACSEDCDSRRSDGSCESGRDNDTEKRKSGRENELLYSSTKMSAWQLARKAFAARWSSVSHRQRGSETRDCSNSRWCSDQGHRSSSSLGTLSGYCRRGISRHRSTTSSKTSKEGDVSRASFPTEGLEKSLCRASGSGRESMENVNERNKLKESSLRCNEAGHDTPAATDTHMTSTRRSNSSSSSRRRKRGSASSNRPTNVCPRSRSLSSSDRDDDLTAESSSGRNIKSEASHRVEWKRDNMRVHQMSDVQRIAGDFQQEKGERCGIDSPASCGFCSPQQRSILQQESQHPHPHFEESLTAVGAEDEHWKQQHTRPQPPQQHQFQQQWLNQQQLQKQQPQQQQQLQQQQACVVVDEPKRKQHIPEQHRSHAQLPAQSVGQCIAAGGNDMYGSMDPWKRPATSSALEKMRGMQESCAAVTSARTVSGLLETPVVVTDNRSDERKTALRDVDARDAAVVPFSMPSHIDRFSSSDRIRLPRSAPCSELHALLLSSDHGAPLYTQQQQQQELQHQRHQKIDPGSRHRQQQLVENKSKCQHLHQQLGQQQELSGREPEFLQQHQRLLREQGEQQRAQQQEEGRKILFKRQFRHQGKHEESRKFLHIPLPPRSPALPGDLCSVTPRQHQRTADAAHETTVARSFGLCTSECTTSPAASSDSTPTRTEGAIYTPATIQRSTRLHSGVRRRSSATAATLAAAPTTSMAGTQTIPAATPTSALQVLRRHCTLVVGSDVDLKKQTNQLNAHGSTLVPDFDGQLESAVTSTSSAHVFSRVTSMPSLLSPGVAAATAAAHTGKPSTTTTRPTDAASLQPHGTPHILTCHSRGSQKKGRASNSGLLATTTRSNVCSSLSCVSLEHVEGQTEQISFPISTFEESGRK